MKALKIILLSILSILIVIYLAFLFVLPYTIDLNQYSPQITKLIQDNTGFQVDINGLKIKTAWNLSAGALIDKTSLSYPDGKKFAQINALQIRLSLLPLFLGQVKVDTVDMDKLLLNADIDKKGEFVLQQFLNNKLTQTLPQKHNLTLKLSKNMPDIKAKKYRISFIQQEARVSKNYTIKGEDLRISDFVWSKKIKVKAKGNLIFNGQKQISYNLNVFSKVFPENKGQKIDIIKFFDDLSKYNVKANVNAHLKIAGTPEETKIDGNLDLNKIFFNFGGEIFPQSNLDLIFKDDNIRINSKLYTGKDSKAVITGMFKNGKNKFIDLKVISEAELKNVVIISNTVLKMLGKKDLQGINANGYIKADFGIKSDFKKIQSNGFLKIKNANITNKLYNVSLSSVNADVDFSQDAVKIKQAAANLNGQPITINGMIDKNAIANISVIAQNLQLKGLLLTSGNAKILKENDINGLINIKAVLKGRLDKSSPKIDALISNFNLVNKQTKSKINFSKATISTSGKRKGNGNAGNAKITNFRITPNAPVNMSAPQINLVFDDKNITIPKTTLDVSGVKTTLSGKISDMSSPKLNSVTISIPNQISLPIKGYSNSKIILKGTLAINGNLYNPIIKGMVNIPLISLPSTSTTLKNTTLNFDKEFTINCQQMQIADSISKFNAQINNNFANGIVAKNVNFSTNNIDLNTLIPVFSKLPKSLNYGSNSSKTPNLAQSFTPSFTILNGKSSIAKFKTGAISANNITSNISLKNNILTLNHLRGEAYYGKVGGSSSYDFTRRKTQLNLQGRGLSANPTLVALTGRNDDINGILDFDTVLSLVGYTQNDLLTSLNGHTNFIISNGQMGALGKFEHLLYAQNILSNNAFKATLNLIVKAITVKNTGVYRYMKGKIAFSNGWANIMWVKTSGPSMSLYMSGRYNMVYNIANLTILGRISDDVVRILGPIGEFSMDKAISYIPKIGEITAYFVNQYTINPNYENTSLIPPLTPKTEFHTKEFKVVIDGDVEKQSSVKSFKWISRPRIAQTQIQQEYISPQKIAPTTPDIPDFVKRLPDLKK